MNKKLILFQFIVSLVVVSASCAPSKTNEVKTTTNHVGLKMDLMASNNPSYFGGINAEGEFTVLFQKEWPHTINCWDYNRAHQLYVHVTNDIPPILVKQTNGDYLLTFPTNQPEPTVSIQEASKAAQAQAGAAFKAGVVYGHEANFENPRATVDEIVQQAAQIYFKRDLKQ